MRDTPIVRIMTTRPITAGSTGCFANARALFESRNIHHLPVGDGSIVEAPEQGLSELIEDNQE